MNQDIPELRSPLILAYSTILPAAWITLSVAGYFIIPGHRLGIVGTVLMFMGVAAFISWLFARRHRRQFSTSEYRRIIGYCIGWALALEFFVLFTVIVLPQLQDGHLDAKPLLFAVPFTIVMDTFFIWLAFRQTGKRVIAWYLRKLEPSASNTNESA